MRKGVVYEQGFSCNIFSGEKTPVGYLCTATPPEIIHAAGGHPFRITDEAGGQEMAEKLAHPNLCGLCKSAITWASALPQENLFVFVATASGDGCKRLGFILDTLRAVSDVIRLDLPRMARPTDLSYFTTQLRAFHE